MYLADTLSDPLSRAYHKSSNAVLGKKDLQEEFESVHLVEDLDVQETNYLLQLRMKISRLSWNSSRKGGRSNKMELQCLCTHNSL